MFETLQGGRMSVVHQEVGNGRVEPKRAAGLQRLGQFLPRAGPLIEAAQQNNAATIVTPYCPTGPARARLDRAEPALNAAGMGGTIKYRVQAVPTDQPVPIRNNSL